MISKRRAGARYFLSVVVVAAGVVVAGFESDLLSPAGLADEVPLPLA